METSLNRNEKLIALFALGAILGFILIFLHLSSRTNSSVSQIDTRSQINYQMARPEEGYSEYSLNGREVEQSYEALAKKQLAQAATKTTNAKATAAPNKLDPKKEAAKKAAQVQQSQNQLRAAQWQDYAKKVAEAQARRANQQVNSNQDGTKSASAADNNSAVASTSAAGQAAPATTDDPAKPKKKTFAEWRALIFAQPTHEMMNTFLAAYRKGDVTATEVQALSQDLLDQNSETLKGLGLYALRATPSLASFSQLVHIEAEVSASYKTYIQQAYLSYLQPANVGYLNQALQTKDKALILKSLNLLNVNLQKVAKGDYSSFSDPRGGRDAASVDAVPMTTFKGLISALTALGSSQDQELAPLAQQVISYIQSTNTVAQNN